MEQRARGSTPGPLCFGNPVCSFHGKWCERRTHFSWSLACSPSPAARTEGFSPPVLSEKFPMPEKSEPPPVNGRAFPSAKPIAKKNWSVRQALEKLSPPKVKCLVRSRPDAHSRGASQPMFVKVMSGRSLKPARRLPTPKFRYLGPRVRCRGKRNIRCPAPFG